MTGMVGVGLQIVLSLIGIFVRRAEKKRQLQKEMIELFQKHNKAVMENVRLRKDYQRLLREIQKDKTKSP